MKCPNCFVEVEEGLSQCPACGAALGSNAKIKSSGSVENEYKFPVTWVGYIMAAVYFIFEIMVGLSNPNMGPADTPEPNMWFGLLILTSITTVVYWCVCVFKIHKTILKITENKYPISPGIAVGFGFIPIFNLYWMFRWTGEIINLINSRDTSRTLKRWVPGLLLLSSLFAAQIGGFLWVIIDFAVLGYLIRNIKKSLEANPVPAPYNDKELGPMSVGARIGITLAIGIPILGLLAAIAIPNFIRAREAALQAQQEAQQNQVAQQ